MRKKGVRLSARMIEAESDTPLSVENPSEIMAVEFRISLTIRCISP